MQRMVEKKHRMKKIHQGVAVWGGGMNKLESEDERDRDAQIEVTVTITNNAWPPFLITVRNQEPGQPGNLAIDFL